MAERKKLVIAGAATVGAALGVYVMIRRSKKASSSAPTAPTYSVSYEPTAADRERWAARMAEASTEDDAPDPTTAAEPVRELWRLYAKLRDLLLRASPSDASMYGDNRFGHLLTDLSKAAFDALVADVKAFQKELAAAVPSGVAALPESEHGNYAFLSEMVDLTLKKLASFQCYEVPTNQLFGPHLELVPVVTQFSPKDTAEDLRDLLHRLRGFPKQVDEMIAAFRVGVERGRTLPPSSIDAMVAQCKSMYDGKTFADSPFAAMATFAVGSKEESAERAAAAADGGGVDGGAFAAAAEAAVTGEVMPAFEKLATFLAEEYKPHARATAGLAGWDGGAEIYASAVQYFTSLPSATAEEVHAMGLEEVARIRTEMAALIEEHGEAMLTTEAGRARGLSSGGGKKTSTIADFMQALKEDPTQAPADGEEIVRMYREILVEAERVSREGVQEGEGLTAAAQPPLFTEKSRPKAAYEVKAVEPFREKHAPPAFYYPPAADGSRGGIFYANTYLAETRGKFVMESIALHEAIPGHHFQIAIAQELAGMPWLRKQVQDFCTAYIEGWGLYTEKLGLEMGFYTDPCQDFGEF